MRHTAGLYYRKDHVAQDDADVVKILKRAGAIPVGVTNVSELCMWWESVNKVYGRSKNPYDTRHITGTVQIRIIIKIKSSKNLLLNVSHYSSL